MTRPARVECVEGEGEDVSEYEDGGVDPNPEVGEVYSAHRLRLSTEREDGERREVREYGGAESHDGETEASLVDGVPASKHDHALETGHGASPRG